MALALDAVSAGASSFGGVTTVSFSHTCTGSDLILFVGGGTQLPVAATPTGVTYNSVAMTQLWTKNDSGGIGSSIGYILGAPSTGTNTVVITYSSTAPSEIFGAGMSFTGGDTATPNRTPANAADTAGGNAPTVTAPSAASGDIVVDCCVFYNSALTVGTNQTERLQTNWGGNATRQCMSTQAGADGGVMSWTGANGFWATGAAALIPAAAAGGLIHRLTTLGVGI